MCVGYFLYRSSVCAGLLGVTLLLARAEAAGAARLAPRHQARHIARFRLGLVLRSCVVGPSVNI